MKILITGHKGLIGSELYKILSIDHEVSGFDRGDSWPDHKRFDMIIHTAANCVIRETIKDPNLARENVLLTTKVYEEARKYKSKVIVFSSARVGHESYNPYTVSKRFNELTAKAYKACYDVESIIIRPETVWGYSYNNERAIIKWIQAARRNEDLVIYGPADKKLSPIYVDQFIEFVLSVVNDFDKYSGQTLQISGQIRFALDIANAIIKKFSSSSKVIFKDGELTQPQDCLESAFTSNVKFEDSLDTFLCKLSQQS